MTTLDAATAFVALGSNLGDRLGHLAGAVAALRDVPGVRVASVSRIVETPALTLPGQAPQPDFLNAVVCVETALGPHDLLAAFHRIEADAGRVRADNAAGRWAARPLDLDLLVYGDLVLDTPGLTLPHPRLTERRFVLDPLAELAPDLVVVAPGGTARTVADWLAALG